MSDWSAAILAGGRATRLGGVVKPLLEVGGATILARQAAVLATLGVEPVLVAPAAAPFAGLPYRVVADVVTGSALGALYTALASATTAHVLVLAGDLPFVTAPFLAHLVARRHDADAVVPAPHGRWQPLCAIYATAAAPALRAQLDRGQLRVTDAVATLRVTLVDDATLATFDHRDRLLLNVNTPGDHESAQHGAIAGD